VTNHRSIDYQMLMDNAALIIDTRNAMSQTTKTKSRVVSLARSRESVPADIS
jgi:UDP-N-acetyl-D-mannosaminuronate dehydrogenase